jgi:hypothetical protein
LIRQSKKAFLSTQRQASSGGTTPEPNSVCKKEGLNADPNDCGIFYQCVTYSNNGWLVYKQHCAPGTGKKKILAQHLAGVVT